MPAMAAKISSAAASSRNGELFLRPREGKPALEPSEIAMLPTIAARGRMFPGASLTRGMRRSSIALFVGRLYRRRVRSPQPWVGGGGEKSIGASRVWRGEYERPCERTRLQARALRRGELCWFAAARASKIGANRLNHGRLDIIRLSSSQ